VFIDNLAIPSNAPRVDLAHRFIDYLLQPKVAAQITQEVLYPNANAGSSAFLDPALLEEAGLYPDQDTKRRLHPVEVLPEKHTAVRDRVWQAFRAGN